MTRLVLLHGRDAGGRDPEDLEALWLDALDAGLASAGSSLRVADGDTTLVYYGDALAGLVGGRPGPPVTSHALAGLDDGELRFALALAREVLAGAGVPAGAGPAVGHDDGTDVRTEGAVGDALAETLAAVLAAIDRFVPGLSGAVVLLFAQDVHRYLADPALRATIDDGVTAALASAEPAVVVAHSLGSVVAYEVLRSAAAARWQVPLLVTLGSPLALRAVRELLTRPLTWPRAERWVNLRDPRDLFALHDLTPATFPMPGAPHVEARHVENAALWRHAAAVRRDDGTWAGYLATPGLGSVVAGAVAAHGGRAT